MEIKLFGKKGCSKCSSTKNKIGYLLKKWNLEEKIRFSYFDLDNLRGLTEGAYYGVRKMPTTIISSRERELARFEGKIPHSSELEEKIRSLLSSKSL